MRNLRCLTSRHHTVESLEAPDLGLSACCWDVVTNSIICAFGPTASDNVIELRRLPADGTSQLITSWDIEPYGTDAKVPGITSLQHLASDGATCLVLTTGDIIVVQAETSPGEERIKIIGTVDDGIEAAEWSVDKESLAIVSSAGSLLLFDLSYDLLSETVFTPEDLKASKAVSVGWGKKETQFQGKRTRTLRDPTVPEMVDSGAISSSDDGETTISWRGDSGFLAVSSRLGSERRVIRVFSREGILDGVSEAVDGLEAGLSWRPEGNIIAGIQREASRLRVIFFERNGLRHGEFDLRLGQDEMSTWGRSVRLSWNHSSTVLAVQFVDRVQLWTMGNYHYYLKQEIFHSSKHSASKMIGTIWHPESDLCLGLYDAERVSRRKYAFSIMGNTCEPGLKSPSNDRGIIAVIDGKTVNLTAFGLASIPPPLCASRISDLAENVVQVAISLTGRSIAVLLAQTIRVYQLDLETGLSHSPRFSKAIRLLEDQYGQGVAFAGDDNLFVATRNERGAIICRTNLLNTEPEFTKIHESNDPLLLYSTSDFRGTGWMTITKTPTVTIFCPRPSELIPRSLENGDHERIPEVPTAHFAVMSTEDVVDCQSGLSQGVAYTFCLLDSGALIFHTSEGSKRLVNNCTSFLVNASHLVFTTTSHVLKFVHLPNIQKLEIPEDDPDKDERVRSVERGALLVTMMPSSSSVVLQMPRGNLETVYPRLLVLSRIRRLLREKVYDGAFRVCRRHRVDLNILFDLDPQEFLRNVEVFIKQLHKAELIDIFLAELRDEDVTQTLYRETLPISAPAEDLPIPLEETNITPSEKADLNHTPALEAPNPSSKVNRICDAFIELLPTVSPSNARSLITAYVCKKPPEIDIALQRIAQIGEHGSDRRRLILEHLCFLVDVNLVYDHALGLYDLQLAVQIARQSQKDPREYLPFLQNLQEMPEHQKCFNIDDTLKRRDRALGHLKAGGDFEVLLRYVSLYGLHEEALALYRDEVKASAALTELYAAELHRQSRFREAGTAYQSLAKYELAKDSYLAASECWREALNCAELASTPAEQLSGLARRFLDSSVEADHHADAAVICANYLSDWDGAVRYLVKAAQFSDAMRMLVRHSEPSTYVAKFEGVYDKALTEVLATDIGLLANMTSQLQAQVPRIMELRGRRATDPLAFYGGHGRGDRDADDNIPDDVSLAASTVNSHLSTSASLFTRYTSSSATGSALTGKTTRRSKRREDRKRAQGKRGTVYEEEYLLSSVCRLIKRAAEARQDVDALLEALIRRGMIVQAQSVKNNWDKLQQAIDMSRALICGSGESKPTTDQSSALTPEVEMIEQVRAAPEIKALSNVTMLGR